MKNERITVRFSEDEMSEIIRNAEVHGCNSSEYVRKCVKGAIYNQHIPADEVSSVLHKLCVNSEFIKNKRLLKIIQEAAEKWSLL